MKGYKALNKDMRAILGNEMQYELGKNYSINGDVIPCKNGFHFCEKIEYLNYYYTIADSRIFEIEANGVIRRHENKYASEKIKLVRELTKEEIKKYFEQNVQSFVCYDEGYVREAVAEQGYGLDVLVNDKNWYVREAVAKQGYELDVLVNDKDWHVRKAVAEQGYGLEVLIGDKDWYVRKIVGRQGYDIDVFADDEILCKNDC